MPDKGLQSNIEYKRNVSPHPMSLDKTSSRDIQIIDTNLDRGSSAQFTPLNNNIGSSQVNTTGGDRLLLMQGSEVSQGPEREF